ncbi:hypothetical protein CCR97_07305 [Rhodoplanes elegans]|uniref:T6SS Phospholipase effector Tle1-like catalytic domain-containing protein n=1 Tax=Rhodoplanes elegans TaxID=29408 RepID=A0A327KYW7_9BRAD|nr:DUF2235 domain-containing protein [Rhodoplanes elegans]MBK5958017.1 hypothetical protein [Rhodoplanes elegans]RAI40598.1 hypothetical protein CH338_05705 [Rhodoplanes elegans]
MANLVVCCDGTWNTPDDLDGGVPAPTNVRKLFNAVAKVDADGKPQKTYYNAGVGTEGGWWNRAVGGGAGAGLARNVKSAYQWLAYNFRPDDRIFLFGFSRGAFTVRSLAGMINRCGLLDITDPGLKPDAVWKRIDLAFDCYRTRKLTPKLTKLPFHHAAPTTNPAAMLDIHFIGVWDTVGALGIPDDLGLLNLIDDPAKHQFHDTRLAARVLHARHAVAIDERRQSFTPTFWTTETGDLEDRPGVKQVWFPGVHSDVGGGYGRTGLSDGALAWMIAEASAPECGLAFDPAAVAQVVPDPRGTLHDSCRGVFSVLKTLPRGVPRLGSTTDGAFHDSATRRTTSPPIQQAPYWATETVAIGAPPRTIDIFAKERWNATGLYLEPGTYRFTASGEWLDGSIACGPAGTADGRFQAGEIAQMAGSLLGKAETLFRTLSGNQQADFWLTKRVEAYAWFALVGVVANGRGADDKGVPYEHTVFEIGAGCTQVIKDGEGGYLYCFANDAWQMYANNHGAVALTIERIA